jgi:SAM-dependent methyltransferase
VTRPRGYAGDAATIDLIYGMDRPPEATTAAGQAVFEYESQMQSALSVRARREYVRSELARLAAARPAACILVLACGHLRELDHLLLNRFAPTARVIALDQDAASISCVRRRFDGDTRVTALERSVSALLNSGPSSRADADEAALQGPFDLIYALGLYDYLSDGFARALTTAMVHRLSPHGTLLVANFVPDHNDAAYMEAVMDWWLIYRDEAAMHALVADTVAGAFAEIATYRDQQQSVVYLRATRASGAQRAIGGDT